MLVVVKEVIGIHMSSELMLFFFFFQAEDGIRDLTVTGVQTCALPIFGVAVKKKIDAKNASHAMPVRRRERNGRTMRPFSFRRIPRLTFVSRHPIRIDRKSVV